MAGNQVQLTFAGGAGSVTGANFLITEKATGVSTLIDCGLHQGLPEEEHVNWDPFPYDPVAVQTLIVTHAHIDHIGRIPKLVADGFRGVIYSTEPTKALAREMLADTARILQQREDAKEIGLDVMYSQKVLDTVFSLWKTTSYRTTISSGDGMSFTLYDAGHILGSALAEVTYNNTSILFTGDLGNSPSPILPDTEVVPGVSYMVTESVYGDRLHETRSERKEKLKRVMLENHKKNGTLIIPIFSLERTQEFLYEMNDLVESKQVPSMPVYLDSPLAIKLTAVYRQYTDHLNEAARTLARGDDIYSFPGLHVTETSRESKRIKKTKGPKIIMAGAGMSTGGRVLFHERDFISDPQNTLLLTGYQAIGTLGREIQEGASRIKIFGTEVPVRATVEVIRGYSGHRDSDGLVSFVEECNDGSLKRVFCTMGEPKASLHLAQRIHDTLGVVTDVPAEGDSVTLEF